MRILKKEIYTGLKDVRRELKSLREGELKDFEVVFAINLEALRTKVVAYEGILKGMGISNYDIELLERVGRDFERTKKRKGLKNGLSNKLN